MFQLEGPALWALYAVGGTVALVVVTITVLTLLVMRELRRPAPEGGSDYTLPNGMRIKHWQKVETEFLFNEIFGPETAYSRDGQLTFAPGQTIVDAGANIGMFTLFAAAATHGHARIVSFEPIPSTFAVLAANCASAVSGAFRAVFKPAPGAALDITPLQLGLSDAPANVVFEHSPRLTIWSAKDEVFVEERKKRFAEDVMRAVNSSPNLFLRLCVPRWVISWLISSFTSGMAATVPVPVKLVTLSSVIDKLGLATIDLLKVDVEGCEVAVLRGVSEAHWPRIQQVVLEVENFAAVATTKAMLTARGFRVAHFATEREKSPTATSEVSMMYATRPGYKPPVVGGSGSGAAASAPASASPARSRSRSVSKGRGSAAKAEPAARRRK